MTTFIHSFQSDWLKRKRTAASWLMFGGAFFIPFILILGQFANADKLPEINLSPTFWEGHLKNNWQSMAIALMPMGIILVTSLLAQIEYKNNAWKQVHTTPQSFTLIFITKLAVILAMMIIFLVLFNVGIYFSAIIPALVLTDVPIPTETFPWMYYIKASWMFFIASLPIIAIQQLISLHYRNFLASVSIGLGFIVASLFALSWRFGYFLPFTHAAIHFMKLSDENKVQTAIPMHWLSLIYFAAFILLAYLLYITKKQKG